MSRLRLCATCGHRYSMSAKACPHCNRETQTQDDGPLTCDELGCVKVATVIIGKRRRCSDHYAQDLRVERTEGPGYAEFKRRLEEQRRSSS